LHGTTDSVLPEDPDTWPYNRMIEDGRQMFRSQARAFCFPSKNDLSEEAMQEPVVASHGWMYLGVHKEAWADDAPTPDINGTTIDLKNLAWSEFQKIRQGAKYVTKAKLFSARSACDLSSGIQVQVGNYITVNFHKQVPPNGDETKTLQWQVIGIVGAGGKHPELKHTNKIEPLYIIARSGGTKYDNKGNLFTVYPRWRHIAASQVKMVVSKKAWDLEYEMVELLHRALDLTRWDPTDPAPSPLEEPAPDSKEPTPQESTTTKGSKKSAQPPKKNTASKRKAVGEKTAEKGATKVPKQKPTENEDELLLVTLERETAHQEIKELKEKLAAAQKNSVAEEAMKAELDTLRALKHDILTVFQTKHDDRDMKEHKKATLRDYLPRAMQKYYTDEELE
jgi:hypothetical protein